MIDWTDEQIAAYKRYRAAMDRVGLGITTKAPWKPFSDVLGSFKVDGQATPLFEANDAWIEYKAAAEAWVKIEPESRRQNRMSMLRGDYGQEQDDWK